MFIKRRFMLAVIVPLVASLACNLLAGNPQLPDAAATLNALSTQAAITIQAASTQYATPGSATVSPTFAFYLTPSLSRTPVPVSRCDAAAFVSDISISDGTTLGRGVSFTKTWRLQNVGTCSWTPSYDVVFVGGDQMSGPSAVALSGNVSPGQSVNLSVNLKAPNSDGHYRGYWKLRNAAGSLFGIGGAADTAFWVDIKVAGPTYVAYTFVGSFCDAAWENNTKALPCPGSKGDDKGYVIKLDAPVMENGDKQEEPGLLTVPKNASNGFIVGTYPGFKVKDGDRFRTWVNCQYKSSGCDVYFRLDYQIGSGDIKTLGKWHEIYEGQFYPVDLDLSFLAGQKVKFILVVTANGSAYHDNALWLAPHILRQGTPPPPPPPTATSTFTPSPTATYTPTATLTPSPTP
jgi:hypothetical protein